MDKYDCSFKRIVDHYFKDIISFLKARYVGETLGEDNITEVGFEDLKKDVTFELARCTRHHVVEASRRKGHFKDWVVKVLKYHTGTIRQL